MILKKFIGKTIEAAKKSAQQMYGDDFVVLRSSDPNGDQEADITVAVDTKSRKGPDQQKSGWSTTRNEKNGVYFEASGGSQGTRYQPNPVSSNLMALRQYAERQQFSSSGRYNVPEPESNGEMPEEISDTTSGKSFPKNGKNNRNAGQVYSRANIRSSAKVEKSKEKHKPATNGIGILTQFDQSKPKFKENFTPATSKSVRQEQREITALHKRFDKLEALLDSALISSNISYVSHPAFQQLIHTGISATVVSGWFSEIIKKGVDPYEQTEMFMSKLSAIIREALTFSSPAEVKKYLLFTGPSGSGKTQLIMKLLMHPDFIQKKKTAVVALLPREKKSHYYTILEPFCREHEIPYFGITSGDEVTTLQKKWEDYEHILIDTPSISMQQEDSFRQYWKIRQVFASLTPLEVHYVVNASLNRFYFKDSSATHHPLHPDYVAITHLDEVSQWGPIIPFLKEMGCSARYISSGDAIPDSLREFNPGWFTQKVLQNG